jgi:hypothetical protein
MQRNTFLKILNPVFGVLMLNQIASGLLREFLPYEVFVILHKRGGLVLAVIAVLHVILNWGWVKASFFRRTS